MLVAFSHLDASLSFSEVTYCQLLLTRHTRVWQWKLKNIFELNRHDVNFYFELTKIYKRLEVKWTLFLDMQLYNQGYYEIAHEARL